MTAIILLLSLLIAGPVWAQSLSLTWKDNSDNEDGFKISRQLHGGSFASIGEVGENVTTFVDNLPDFQTYCYQVSAFNADGRSGFSNTACGTPVKPVVVPNTPSGLTVTIVITITPTP